jgi:cellobiose phosphorylase
MAAPLVAAWLSQPTRRRTHVVSDADRQLFRRAGRKTWRFFETFVTAQDNWLPPDNWQEGPRQVLARRTSPTNIGLYLLSVLAARDLGYVTLTQVAQRLEDTLDSVEKMERYRGHLLNWYDTETLGKLQPSYVSTVDSGNLVCHLVALARGCEEMARGPLLGAFVLDGLGDELALLTEHSPASTHERFAARLAEARRAPSDTPEGWHGVLEDLYADAERGQLAAAGEWGKVLVCHLGALRMEPTPGPAHEALRERLLAIAARADALAEDADFRAVYDRGVQLFSIGFNLEAGRRDPSHYDLLASECRVASLWAVATGQVPQSHWFRLGRPLTRSGRDRALLAWSGTMFEHLMPALITRTYWRTLLDETYEAVVSRQVSYGRSHGVPWGISESAYNSVDLALNHQYRAFGVPGLGLQPGLAEDLVIAPYATVLASLIAPDLAAANLRALAAEGLDGAFGYYESKDYTPSRTPPGARGVVVRSFMAHHQGMSLVAIDDLLNGEPMVRRFHADRRIRATELLLQERVPGPVPIVEASQNDGMRESLASSGDEESAERAAAVDGPVPSVHLLSNGSYSLFLTATGGGASSYRGSALTRWREDGTLDGGGLHVYVRDAATAACWSTTLRPTTTPADEYRVTYALEAATFRRVDGTIETVTEVVVSPERPGEVRQVTLVNHGDEPRTLEITSYAEVALNTQAADLAHPAFGNLFVESWLDEPSGALLLSRRPRTADEARVWMAHAAEPIRGEWAPEAEHETSRADFLGRGRSAARPRALDPGARLGGTTGAVLDPCIALRRIVTIAPRRRATIAFVLAAGDSRDAVLGTVAQLATEQGVARAFELAWTDARVELRHLGIGSQQAHRFHELASSIIFNDGGRRGAQAVVARNIRTQSNLWAYGISGDHPIVLVRLDDDATDLVHDLLLAHEFWRVNGLTVDLVILNEHPGGYLQPMQDALMRLVQGGTAQAHLDQPGGVFIRRGDQIADEDKDLLQSVARIVLTTSKGSLGRQLARRGDRPAPTIPWVAPQRIPPQTPGGPQPEWIGRAFWNGIGGLTEDGREYVIDLPAGTTTPAPWVNVVANPSFGFVVSESGGGFTWQGNSQTNRLTPWSNDPAVDPCGEALYIRDDETGQVWSPTPQPATADGHYRVRHGQGYSRFEHVGVDLSSDCTVFAAREDAAKIWRVRVRNPSGRTRRLSVTFYVEWVLGSSRERAAPHVVTEWDAAARVLLARNRYADRAGRVAFMATSASVPSFTGDRSDFLGRNGTRAAPAALVRGGELGGHVGAGRDPCGALQARIDIGPNDEREVIFVLGQGDSPDEARRLASDYADRSKPSGPPGTSSSAHSRFGRPTMRSTRSSTVGCSTRT